MKSICAWCGTELPGAPEPLPEGLPITHGICRACAGRIIAEVSTDLGSFLDRLPLPVLVVDGDGAVRTGNRPARELLGKDLPEIRGRLGGQVFECVFAELPEGCGRTMHCQGCAIRRSVTDTFRTGRSQRAVPASLRPGDGGEVRFRITTEKVGEHVLLQIDEVEGADA